MRTLWTIFLLVISLQTAHGEESCDGLFGIPENHYLQVGALMQADLIDGELAPSLRLAIQIIAGKISFSREDRFLLGSSATQSLFKTAFAIQKMQQEASRMFNFFVNGRPVFATDAQISLLRKFWQKFSFNLSYLIPDVERLAFEPINQQVSRRIFYSFGRYEIPAPVAEKLSPNQLAILLKFKEGFKKPVTRLIFYTRVMSSHLRRVVVLSALMASLALAHEVSSAPVVAYDDFVTKKEFYSQNHVQLIIELFDAQVHVRIGDMIYSVGPDRVMRFNAAERLFSSGKNVYSSTKYVVNLTKTPAEIKNIQRAFEFSVGQSFVNATYSRSSMSVTLQLLGENVLPVLDAHPNAVASYYATRKILGDPKIGSVFILNPSGTASVGTALKAFFAASLEFNAGASLLPVSALHRVQVEADPQLFDDPLLQEMKLVYWKKFAEIKFREDNDWALFQKAAEELKSEGEKKEFHTLVRTKVAEDMYELNKALLGERLTVFDYYILNYQIQLIHIEQQAIEKILNE